MKKLLIYLTAACCTFAGCSKETAVSGCKTDENTGEGLVPVTVTLSGIPTRAGDSESTVNSLQVVLYRAVNDELIYESYYDFDPEEMKGTIYVNSGKEAERYLIAAYANQETLTEAKHADDWSLFSEEAQGDFQMYGEWRGKREELKDEVSISLKRQCSKVSVKKVSLDWTNSANYHKSFKLKAMYLMDTQGVLQNVSALTQEVKTANPWLNMNGNVLDKQDTRLYKEISPIELTSEKAYDNDQVFYAYISDLSNYNISSNWEECGTRLVLEAEFDNKTCYYAVPLRKSGIEGTYRNIHFIFENIVITKPGADSPFGIPATESPVDIRFSIASWDEINHGTVTLK